MSPEPINFANTALPLGLTGVLAILIPEFLAGQRSTSQKRLAAMILGSAGLLLGVGAITLAILYAQRGSDVTASLTRFPVQTSLYFLSRSGLLALFWGPLLVLVWLIKAQAVEARRGLARADLGRGA